MATGIEAKNVFHNMHRTLYIIFLPCLIMLNFPFHKNVNYLTRKLVRS